MSSKARDLRRRILKSRTDTSKSIQISKTLTSDFQNQTVKKPTIDPLNFLNSYSTKLDSPKITEFISTNPLRPKRLSFSLQPFPRNDNNFKSNFCDIIKVKQNLIKLKSNEIHFKKEELFGRESLRKNLFPKEENNRIRESVNENEEIGNANNLEMQIKKTRIVQPLHKSKKCYAFISKKKKRNEMIEQITFKVKQIQKRLNFTPHLLEKVNNIMNSLQLPRKCIIDDDVQFVSDESNYNLVVPIKHLTNLDIRLCMKQC